MDSLLFAINAVAPIIIMVAIGYILKKLGFMNVDFAGKLNKIVFRLLLPAMLFLNVYKINSIKTINGGFIIYTLIATLVIFVLSVPLVILITRDNKKRGPLLQGTFRSNYALIGIPLAQSLFGIEGAAVASLLSAVLIPFYNVLAVISLSVFSDSQKKVSVAKIFKDIIKNPLIISIAVGGVALAIRYVFAENGIEFRLGQINAIYKPLEYLSSAATPIALLVLGAQFEFSQIKEMRREIVFGTAMKCAFVPFAALFCAYVLFGDSFGGAQFAAMVAAFATPVAVSTVPMAQEMASDERLAGQLVVWTTLFSSLSVFLSSLILKILGVF